MGIDVAAIGAFFASLGVKSLGDFAILVLMLLAIPRVRRWLGFNGNGKHSVSQEQLQAHVEADGAKFAAIEKRLDLIVELLKAKQ